MNSNPTLNEPVPDKAWTVTILPALTAYESYPKINFWEAVLNPASPSIGIYSYIMKGLLY
jgi:hypothetical protein